MVKISIFFLFSFLLSSFLYAQETGDLFIRNYDRSEYHASISNWGTIQDNRGVLYVVNYNGVLEFDSKNWSLIPAPNNTSAVSMGKSYTGRLFLGTTDDFGYLKADSAGKLQFVSLKGNLVFGKDFSTIFRILVKGDEVFFFSFKSIVTFKENKISVTPSGENRFKHLSFFNINNSLYLTQDNVGLVILNDGVTKPVKGGGYFKDKNIFFMDQLGSAALLIGTMDGRFYKYHKKDGSVEVIDNELTGLSKTHYYHGIKYNNSGYLLGSTKNGITMTDSALNTLRIINKSNHLQSEFIRDLYMDSQDGLWSSMHTGVSRIDLISPWQHWKESVEIGSIWQVIKYEGKVYIGHTKGLHVLEKGKFRKIEGIHRKVWSLSKVQEKGKEVLLVGSEEGLYKVVGLQASIVIESLANKIIPLRAADNSFLVGHTKGLSIIRLKSGKFEEKIIEGMSGPKTYQSILEDNMGNLWVSIKFDGIYKITDPFSDTPQLEKYGMEHGLPDVNEINIIEDSGTLLFTTGKGFYRLNQASKTPQFVPDSRLFSPRIKIDRIAKDNEGNYFISVIDNNKEHLEKLVRKENDTFVREYIPFKRLPDMEVLNIYTEGNGIVWISGSNGLFRYDESVQKDYRIPFNTLIRKVSLKDSIIFHGSYPLLDLDSGLVSDSIKQPKYYRPQLDYDDNDIVFNYAAAWYEVPEKTMYSYYLKNNDENWSSWSFESRKEYSNLPPGTYTFMVKSKNLYEVEGRIAAYTFRIFPPWYRTYWAYGVFAFLFLFLIWIAALTYSYRMRLQRRKLKLIVADRTYEVMTQKKEIEKQHNLLILQNREIVKQRDDIQFKNIALENSKEEILDINQKLKGMNAVLEIEVEKRTSKIKATLAQLRKTNKELDTFVYRASHDLKSPISRIIGLTALAKLESPSEINSRYFDLIESASKDMRRLLAKLAQVHEIYHRDVFKEEIDLPTIISGIRENIKFLESGQSIKYLFAIDTDLVLSTDEYLIKIVLENLMENALIFRKQHQDNEHCIHIETFVQGDFYHINVYDNGIGIPEDHRDKLYNMFFRASDQSSGSGLGLYLVKMAIDKIAGKIEISSRNYEFTMVSVSIPI